jgi:hypothetical protein
LREVAARGARGYNRRDAGRVYRHLTQENRQRTYLEVDWVRVR